MRAAVAVDESLDPERALAGASAAAGVGLGCDPDIAIGFVGSAYGAGPADLQRASQDLAGARVGVAVHVEGLLWRGGECFSNPAVAVVALETTGSGFDLHSFDHARGRERELGDELLGTFGDLVADDLVLLVADARELDSRLLAPGLAQCAPASVLGLGVEGLSGGGASHAIGGEVFTGGALALRLRAPSSLRCALAPGAAITVTRTVTSARGHWIFELDGASALEEFRDAAGALWDDERRAMRSVLVALPERRGAEPEPALARRVVGIDEERGAIALAESIERGERLAFARRDAISAREALAEAAVRLSPVGDGSGCAAGDGSGLGLAASCRARGPVLFGHAGIESGYLDRAFAPAPWLGLVGSYQIAGTPGSPASLLTHAAALVRLA
jgi:small ligand-binding sensory domain FIST